MILSSPIVHHPLSFHFGPLELTGFGIAVLMAFLIAQVTSERELARRGHDRESAAISDVIFAAVFGTLLGAKLYYVVVITHNIADLFNRSGFVFWGGFMGAVALCAITIRYKKLSFVRFADVGGIAIAAGYSIGRTGCWAVGDDYGKPWNGILSVAFPNGSPPSTAADMAAIFHVPVAAGVNPATVLSVYPTQIFEVAMGFIMFAILWRIRDHKHAEGWLFGAYCVLAGVERFIVEFFRAKDDRFGFALGLSTAQLIAIAIVVVGAAIMYGRRNTSPNSPGIYGRAASAAA